MELSGEDRGEKPANAPLFDSVPSLVSLCGWTVTFVLLGSVLHYGSDVLIPLAVAILIWHLINALARGFERLLTVHLRLPRFTSYLLALLSIFGACWFTVVVVASNVAAVSLAAPTYQANLLAMLDTIAVFFGIEEIPSLNQLMALLDITGMVGLLSATLGGLAGNAGLVALYVMFLLLEQSSFDNKLNALFRRPGRRIQAQIVLVEIERRIERYLWIKTVLSLLTAFLSFGLLTWVGVDYADFWAIVVFLFNFIPTIGSIFAVILPALLTLVQFASFSTFALVAISLVLIQFVIGNVIEPRILGNSLNLSPLAIMLSLALWSSLWGIAGMFLCVPIMVILLIIFSQFEMTRPLAILFSESGDID